jgi:uracil-DNA glycosylase
VPSTDPLFDLPDSPGRERASTGLSQQLSPADGAALEQLAVDPLSLMSPDWSQAMEPVEDQLRRMGRFLQAEQDAGRGFLPAAPLVLRAFQRPLADVRVLVVGQDPYPTPGHAVGLSFSVDKATRPLPRSLANIFRERESDVGLPPSTSGDLSAWLDRGVLLLNRVLTVRPGVAGSHRGQGWEAVTELAISVLDRRGSPLVAVLWGADAGRLESALPRTAVVRSAHPSPLSAARGFFGSRPFSRVNTLLAEQGAEPIDWSLPTG